MRYAPMYVLHFRLTGRSLRETERFFRGYSELRTVQERLRWCRCHKGLWQAEAAALIGVSTSQYKALENGEIDYYEPETVDKLAALYQISADDLLDDYNRFLYYGQGRLIREHRESLGLTRTAYALRMKVAVSSLRAWERETKRITKPAWERFLKDVIETKENR